MVKKQQTPKKITAKKTTKKAPAKRKPTGQIEYRRVFVGVAATVLALAAAIVLAYVTLSLVHKAEAAERKDRIMAVYDKLSLDEQEYQVEKVNVFGDKRPYDWDKSRTWSSSIEYTHGDTVANTTAKLDEVIKTSGFMFINEPYPSNGNALQYHYKSDKGEYLRLTVVGKPYIQAIQNALQMGDMSDETRAGISTSVDPNAGPVKVTIKVNLDDNNE